MMSTATNHVICLFAGTPPRELKMAALPGWHSAFLAFRTTPPPVDGGPVTPIRQALAQALCAHWAVTFVGELGDEAPGPAWQRHGNYAARRQARWPRRALPLVWTRAPEIAVHLFDQHWSSETQVALFGEGEAPVDIEGAVGGHWHARTLEALLGQPGCCGALVPGVDGDFAALHVRDDATLGQWQDSLRVACRAQAVDLRYAQTAAEFMRAGT
ncbi:MAG: hypothetical protein LC098_08650 [Burkholderiales bacterium]|nr:hypothetical protein [Burkholderiales bacterium]